MHGQQTNKPDLRWRVLAFLLSILFCSSAYCVPAAAAVSGADDAAPPGGERVLIPVGRAVGIKLFAQGVLVVAISDLKSDGQTISPAQNCGLKVGDILSQMNGQNIESTEQLQSFLQENGEQPITLTVQRGGKDLSMTIQPHRCDDGVWRLGAWIRDSMAGIGTITFYDPSTGLFGALGHGITDVDTAMLMPLSSGAIMDTSIKAVKKGESGSPGELKGDFDLTHDTGTLYANTASGIFGTAESSALLTEHQALPAAKASDVKTGEATILANINGDTVTEYSVEIVKIYAGNQPSRNMLVRVTDQRLLQATGGIVQGMSGSPILQNGKLIGAVTHVLLNDPTQGYGIFIDNMLDAAG